MKKILSILTCAALITGVMSSNVFAASINDIPDKKISQSEKLDFNGSDGPTIDIQNTASGIFVNWGASIAQSDAGYIKVQGSTESYMNVGTIGYTLNVQKNQNGSWVTIKTFSYSLNNTYTAMANHNLAVSSKNSYRVSSTNYIINNGVKTSKTSISNAIYIN
ncbi:hypothetical protein [Clostridium tagluense]|uniref:hypothetical protein n=1 Tax=Clostridium tagluense TaxID=360422 RepID=UPI001C6EED9E|nr:hypothetical protein [Clostridium tagluense]MBW9159473.1 hypothetical protein [Clostridium tagluense]WLC68481.1 hypothetical protein KTC93_25545 [Clostridium tagluense]